ncbi:MAG: cupin domain-containing protein [bacterium]
MSDQLFRYLDKLQKESINHGDGQKIVFRRNEQLNNNLTQIAYGEFKPNEYCELHHLPTMDEYFYFIEGEGIYIVDNEDIKIKPGTFLEIPAQKEHKLKATGKSVLKFVYWGVAK